MTPSSCDDVRRVCQKISPVLGLHFKVTIGDTTSRVGAIITANNSYGDESVECIFPRNLMVVRSSVLSALFLNYATIATEQFPCLVEMYTKPRKIRQNWEIPRQDKLK